MKKLLIVLSVLTSFTNVSMADDATQLFEDTSGSTALITMSPFISTFAEDLFNKEVAQQNMEDLSHYNLSNGTQITPNLASQVNLLMENADLSEQESLDVITELTLIELNK